jgi:hypothetical protein
MDNILKHGQILKHKRELLQKQKSICPICNNVILLNDAVLDHCHSTGFVRSVLHDKCNKALGFIEWAIETSDKDAIVRIGEYLRLASDNPSNLIHPKHAKLEQLKINRAVRISRFTIKDEDKIKYINALENGPMIHPNPKKNTSALGSWRRTALHFNINYGRLLCYVNNDRSIDELK